jgi:hypothetical protein
LAGAWQAQTGRGNGYRGVSVAVVEGQVRLPVQGAATRFGIAAVRIGRGVERVAIEATVAVTAFGGSTRVGSPGPESPGKATSAEVAFLRSSLMGFKTHLGIGLDGGQSTRHVNGLPRDRSAKNGDPL